MATENNQTDNGLSYEDMFRLAQSLREKGQSGEARIVVEMMVNKWPERVLNRKPSSLQPTPVFPTEQNKIKA